MKFMWWKGPRIKFNFNGYAVDWRWANVGWVGVASNTKREALLAWLGFTWVKWP